MYNIDYNLLNLILPRYLRVIGQNKFKNRHNYLNETINDDDQNKVQIINNIKLYKIYWAPGFYAIPGYISLNNLTDSNNNKYIDNGLYSMDISSALTVYILDILSIPNNQDCKILDLCCCPGGKFQMISELLTKQSIIIGVDISINRLNVFKSLLKSWKQQYSKYQYGDKTYNASNIDNMLPRQLVFQCDGTCFSTTSIGNLIYDSYIMNNEFQYLHERKHINKSSKDRINKSLKIAEKNILDDPSILINFDYVLVDAECTHDVSYRHLPFINNQYSSINNNTSSNMIINNNDDNNNINTDNNNIDSPNIHKRSLNDKITSYTNFIKSNASLSHQKYQLGNNVNNNNIEDDNNNNYNNSNDNMNLKTLQRNLIHNGFKLLKPGGILVYSTCSEDIEQNENIVKWLLETEYIHAELLHISNIINQLFPFNQMNTTTNNNNTTTNNYNNNTNDNQDMNKSNQINVEDIINNKIDINSINGLDILKQLNPNELNYLLNNLNENNIKDLSTIICTDISKNMQPIVYESDILNGTIRLSYKSGMSGHYIAKIKRKEIT